MYVITTAANQDEQHDREQKAATGTLILSVRAATAEKRNEATAILRAAGATQVEAR